MGGGARLFRLNRPSGSVPVHGKDGLTLVVRINLMARSTTIDRTHLKQCLAPDYFVVVAPGSTTTLAAHNAQTLLRLEIAPGHVEASQIQAGALKRLHGRVYANAFISGLVEQLAGMKEAAQARLSASLIETLLLSLSALADGPGVDTAQGGLTARQLAILRDHVESRLGEALRNTDLARLVDLSPFHFVRAFKRSMGATPAAWIKLRRMTVAQKLLADQDRSITDIAAALGYDSPSRFSSAFRAATGVSPSKFRRNARDAAEPAF